MEVKNKTAVEEYQFSGCISGYNVECFVKSEFGGIGCGKHLAGTFLTGVGKILLGMPKGFNRLGESTNLRPEIYNLFDESDWKYNMWNIPCWKFKDEFGNTIVRGLMPRRNEPFIHIYLEDCLDKIDCLEITQEDVNGMD